MKILSKWKQRFMIAKAPFKPDSYCNCCGQTFGVLGPYSFIKYGKPTIYLCWVCMSDYRWYSRRKEKYDFFSKVV